MLGAADVCRIGFTRSGCCRYKYCRYSRFRTDWVAMAQHSGRRIPPAVARCARFTAITEHYAWVHANLDVGRNEGVFV